MAIDIDDIDVSKDKKALSFAAEVEKYCANANNEEDRLLAIEELCKTISREKSIIVRDSMISKLSEVFGAKKAVIKSTVISLIDEEKQRMKTEADGFGLQDGVDENEALEFGIYEYKGRYWAIGKFGKYEVTNFTMKVLYHVKTSDTSAYRLVEIKNVFNKTSIINLNTDDFVSLGGFKKVIARFGNYIFKGADADLAKLSEKLQRDEKPTRLVQTLGYNKRGNFYAFANGIIPCNSSSELHFIPTDEYGIITEFDNENYFIPANSRIFEEKDNLFTNDKKFVFVPNNHCNFNSWAAQTYRVYGDKAIVGTLFYLSAIYRDIIFQAIGRRFPILNCYGQRGSGKGTFIESFMWPFGKPQDQIMLGGASTTVGFMRKFAQFSNAFVWLDEYKNSLQLKMIESLKNIYDGIGYERGKKDNTFETESTPINSACILSGQEMPTAEPALFTRVIMLSFKPGKGFTEADRREFKKLQEMQSQNLSHITAHVALHREFFSSKYREVFEETFTSIIKKVNNKEVDERMMLNIAALAATYKVATDFLQFPYEYEKAEEFLIKNMKEQFTTLAGSDDIAKWWQVVENLFTLEIIEEGRDFELENGYLYLRIQNVHPLYQKELRTRNDPHALDKSTLEHYLEMDSNVYVDKPRKRFSDGSNTWSYKFIYRNTGINLLRKGTNETLDQLELRETQMQQTDEAAAAVSENGFKGTEKKDDLPF